MRKNIKGSKRSSGKLPAKRSAKKEDAADEKQVELTEDQKQWMKTFGNLDDYSNPEQRAEFQRKANERHALEAGRDPKLPPPDLTKKKVTMKPVVAPGVYRDRGYIVLALSTRDGGVTFLDVSAEAGKVRNMSFENFLALYEYREELLPAALALNLIARVVQGTFVSSVQVYRRLIAMALDKDQLMKMGEREFAREYSRLMKLEHPVDRIRAKDRTPYINQMLAKLEEEKTQLENNAEQETATAPSAEMNAAATADAAASAESTTAPADPQSPKAEAATAASVPEKGVGMVTKAKKKASGAAAKKKSDAASIVYKEISKANPYREGSKKNKAFEIFKKGGTRVSILAAIKKLEVTDATASTWLYFFKAVADTGKQADWDEPRSAKAKKEPKAAKKKAAKKKAKA